MVKEADALTEAGHQVSVICAFWAAWADAADTKWLSARKWTCKYVGGHPENQRPWYLLTRLRHGLAKRAMRYFSALGRVDTLAHCALSRTTPELISAAKANKADLYIAHNLGALPAAVIAAGYHGSLAGFDAEDFHGPETGRAQDGELGEPLAMRIEKQFIGKCDYLTASSPEIATAYADRYAIDPPLTVLNVFPLHQQPAYRAGNESAPLQLYWFSQTIGANRGLDDVVQAMGRIGGADVELHLRGIWQPGYRECLYNLAGRNGVREGAIIWHEPGLPDEMPRLAAQHDIGLSTEQPLSMNKNLCLGNKIFTYLLAGNAIVTTETSAQSRLAKTVGAAARVYAPGNVDALAEILRTWNGDRNLLEQARRHSWQAGRDQYNWDNEKDKLLNHIENIIHR
jgi:hypothetical protein